MKYLGLNLSSLVKIHTRKTTKHCQEKLKTFTNKDNSVHGMEELRWQQYSNISTDSVI